MNPTLEENIIEKYKYMFFDEDGISTLDYNFEIDDGWKDIVDLVLFEINSCDINKTIRITVIKEKFGELRIYYVSKDASDELYDKIHQIINKYTKLSKTTCEICGAKGKQISLNSYIKTLCTKHIEEFKTKTKG